MEQSLKEPRPEKVAVVDEVRAKLTEANAAILTEYRGLPVSQLEALRRALTAAGGEYKVYKNTLVRRAASECGLGVLEDLEDVLRDLDGKPTRARAAVVRRLLIVPSERDGPPEGDRVLEDRARPVDREPPDRVEDLVGLLRGHRDLDAPGPGDVHARLVPIGVAPHGFPPFLTSTA